MIEELWTSEPEQHEFKPELKQCDLREAFPHSGLDYVPYEGGQMRLRKGCAALRASAWQRAAA